MVRSGPGFGTPAARTMTTRLAAVAAPLAFLLFLAAVGAPRVAAHAVLEAADPAPGSVLLSPPTQVVLTFGEEPDAALSEILVLDSSGRSHTAGPAGPGTDESQLVVPLGEMPDGTYTVAWRTLAADDGHVTSGTYEFTVSRGTGSAGGATGGGVTGGGATGGGTGGPGAQLQTTIAGASPGLLAGRWLMWLGLLGLLGSAFLGSVLLRGSTTPVPLRLAGTELALAIAGGSMLTVIQIAESGAQLAAVPGSSLGRDAAVRLVPLVLAAGLLGSASAAAEPARRGLLAGAGGLAALVLLGESFFSHAASQAFAPVGIAVTWLHFVGVGIWLGGLPALIAGLRGPEAPDKETLAHRFALLAAAGLGIVAATGVLRALADVGTIDALVTTDFGRLVILKAGLLGLVATLGAINHFYVVPRTGRTLAPLRRVGATELALGLLVLVVASALVNLPPPTGGAR